jgi:hypothetical protein
MRMGRLAALAALALLVSVGVGPAAAVQPLCSQKQRAAKWVAQKWETVVVEEAGGRAKRAKRA